jgi:hypothetical protein
MPKNHHTTILSRDALLKNNPTTILSRDALLKNNHTTISSRDALLKNHHTTISSRDALLKNHHTTIPSRDALLKNHHTTIPSRDALLKNNHTTISSRDALWRLNLGLERLAARGTMGRWDDGAPQTPRVKGGIVRGRLEEAGKKRGHFNGTPPSRSMPGCHRYSPSSAPVCLSAS